MIISSRQSCDFLWNSVCACILENNPLRIDITLLALLFSRRWALQEERLLYASGAELEIKKGLNFSYFKN